MEEFKKNTKEYRIIELSLPDNYRSGVTISNLCTYYFDSLLNEDERDWLKSNLTDKELNEKRFRSLSDIISYYCSTFNYSLISIQRYGTSSYSYLIALLKD